MHTNAYLKIRPAKINIYLRYMQELGYSSKQVLSGASISENKLSDPYYLVEMPDYMQVASNMLELTCDSGLAFRLGAKLIPSDLGILGLAVSTCPSLLEAIKLWQKYNGLFVGNLFAVTAYKVDKTIQFEFSPRVEIPQNLMIFFLEEKFTTEIQLFRIFNNCHLQNKYYKFAFAEPEHSQLYHEFMPGPVTFNNAKTVFAVAEDDETLNRPLLYNDAESLRVCREYLETAVQTLDELRSNTAQLRYLIKQRLPKILSVREAAREFNCSVRTFSRELERENTTYNKEIIQVRKSLAESYIATTGLEASEIAYKLGYSDAGSFRRAFKTWTGMSLSTFKQSIQDSKN